MNHQFIYGDKTVTFRVRYRESIRGKVAIHVQPDQQVIVDAPSGTTLPVIKQALAKRARWVINQQNKPEELHRNALPRQYVSGETHWYMGKRCLLKVKASKTAEAGTRLQRGTLVVTQPENAPQLVQSLLIDWYQQRAQIVFKKLLDLICAELGWVKQTPDWQQRAMKKQWGSCSPKGKLSLNPMLIKAPRACIDYVILHELYHLEHHNHSNAFYRLLKRELPEWEMVKKRLDDMAEQVLM